MKTNPFIFWALLAVCLAAPQSFGQSVQLADDLAGPLYLRPADADAEQHYRDNADTYRELLFLCLSPEKANFFTLSSRHFVVARDTVTLPWREIDDCASSAVFKDLQEIDLAKVYLRLYKISDYYTDVFVLPRSIVSTHRVNAVRCGVLYEENIKATRVLYHFAIVGKSGNDTTAWLQSIHQPYRVISVRSFGANKMHNPWLGNLYLSRQLTTALYWYNPISRQLQASVKTYDAGFWNMRAAIALIILAIALVLIPLIQWKLRRALGIGYLVCLAVVFLIISVSLGGNLTIILFIAALASLIAAVMQYFKY